jgi:CDP-2,3-bis-(O-geranylgeranyl)-sn-glycerol synthase
VDFIRSLLLPLALLVTSNTVPWLLGIALGPRGAAPLDLGRRWRDGERLFGAHKTWRGLASAIAGTGLVGWLAGLDPGLAAVFGALAMAGDLLSSFVKRRLRLAPGRDVPGLDQLPECLVPLIALARPLALDATRVVTLAAAFTVGHLLIARLRRGVG